MQQSPKRHSPGRLVLRAIPWGLGAGVGVALGGWLTAVGGVGAPGVQSLEPGVDLFVLPIVGGLLVVIGHIAVDALAQFVRARRVQQVPEQQQAEQNAPQ